MKKLLVAIVVAAIGAMALQGATAAETVFGAILDGAQSGTASPATGFGTFKLSDDETQLSYHIEFSGLLAPETNAHFHKGAPGVSGGVVKQLPTPGSPKIGVWAATDVTQPLTAQAVADLKAGLLYINIHTEAHTGGEIRGQIVPEPSSLMALAAGGLGLLGMVRRRSHQA